MSRPPSIASPKPAKKEKEEKPQKPPFESWASRAVTKTFNKAGAYANELFFADPNSKYFDPAHALARTERAYFDAYTDMVDEFELIKEDREAFLKQYENMDDNLTDDTSLAHAFRIYRRAIELLDPENFSQERARISEAQEAKNQALQILGTSRKNSKEYKEAEGELKTASKELIAAQKAYAKRLSDAKRLLQYESFQRAIDSFLHGKIKLGSKELPLTVKQGLPMLVQMLLKEQSLVSVTISTVGSMIGLASGFTTPLTLVLMAVMMFPQIVDWTKKGINKLDNIVKTSRAKSWKPMSRIRTLSGDDVTAQAKRDAAGEDADLPVGRIVGGPPDDDLDPAQLKGTRVAGVPFARQLGSDSDSDSDSDSEEEDPHVSFSRGGMGG